MYPALMKILLLVGQGHLMVPFAEGNQVKVVNGVGSIKARGLIGYQKLVLALSQLMCYLFSISFCVEVFSS